MESPHPEERPAKKRRFFTEDSSPVQFRTKQPPEPAAPPSPPPAADSHGEAQGAEAPAHSPGIDSEGFDVAMLEAVVGNLSISTIKKLKDVSGNNVERGRRSIKREYSSLLTCHSNKLISRWIVELCARSATCLRLSTPPDTADHLQHPQARRV
jgi:hypothetical protein